MLLPILYSFFFVAGLIFYNFCCYCCFVWFRLFAKSGGPLLQHLESTSKIKNRERECTFQNPQATNAFHFISPLLLLLYLKFRGVDDGDGDDDELLGRWRWGWMDGWMTEPNGSLNIFWLTNWQPARLTNGWWCDRSHVYKQELNKKVLTKHKSFILYICAKMCVCLFSKCWNVFWVLDVTIFLSILFWRANSSFLFCLCGCVCVQTFS